MSGYPRIATLEEQLYRHLNFLGTNSSQSMPDSLAQMTTWAERFMTPDAFARALVKALHGSVSLSYNADVFAPYHLHTLNLSTQAIKVVNHIMPSPALVEHIAAYYSQNLSRISSWNLIGILPLLRTPAVRAHPRMQDALRKALNPTRRRAAARFDVDRFDHELIMSLLIDPTNWAPTYAKYHPVLEERLRKAFVSNLTAEHITALAPSHWPLVLLNPELLEWAHQFLDDAPPLPTQALAKIAAHGAPFLRSWVVKQMATAPARPPLRGCA